MLRLEPITDGVKSRKAALKKVSFIDAGKKIRVSVVKVVDYLNNLIEYYSDAKSFNVRVKYKGVTAKLRKIIPIDYKAGLIQTTTPIELPNYI